MVFFLFFFFLGRLPSKGHQMADGQGENRFCILDFGLCRRFLDDSGRIKPPRSRGKDGFRGSTSYASVSSHKGDELGRRDDLWSLFYVIVECLYGSLPWRGIQVEPGTKGNENEEEDSGDLLKKRIRMSKDESMEDPDLLTAGEGALPGWAVDLSEYIRSLRFERAGRLHDGFATKLCQELSSHKSLPDESSLSSVLDDAVAVLLPGACTPRPPGEA